LSQRSYAAQNRRWLATGAGSGARADTITNILELGQEGGATHSTPKVEERSIFFSRARLGRAIRRCNGLDVDTANVHLHIAINAAVDPEDAEGDQA